MSTRETSTITYMSLGNLTVGDRSKSAITVESPASEFEMSLACHLLPGLASLMVEIRDQAKVNSCAMENIISTSREAVNSYSRRIHSYTRKMIADIVSVKLVLSKILKAEPICEDYISVYGIVDTSVREGTSMVNLVLFSTIMKLPRVIAKEVIRIIKEVLMMLCCVRDKLDTMLIACSVINYLAVTDWTEPFILKTKSEAIIEFEEGDQSAKGMFEVTNDVVVFKYKMPYNEGENCCSKVASCKHWKTRKDLLSTLGSEWTLKDCS
jgi:hypothetical protein